MREFYYLYLLSRDPCEYDKIWYASALASNLICRGCSSVNAYKLLPDIKLSVVPDRASVNFIPQTGLLVVSEDFVEGLGDDVLSKYIDLGRLIGPGNEIIDSYYSFRGKHSILIRGNKLSSHRVCAECGRQLYHPKGKMYLIRPEIGDSPIYHAQVGLVVEDTLYEKIRQIKPRKLGAGKIAIKQKASDGFDIELASL